MISLASALAETVFAVMEDIRNATHAIDMSEIYRQSPETSSGTTSARKRLLVNNFDDVIRRQLEGADTRSTQRVRSLLADLVTLRKLLRDVYELNSILFHQQIVTIRATAVRGGGWLVRKEAQRVVSISRARVWQLRRPPAQNSESADNSQNGEQVPEPAPINTIASLEHYPKWNALRAVLREIASDVKTAGVEADVGRILVCVREQAAVEEITQVLRNGNEPYLQSLFEQVFPSVAARAKDAKRPRQLTLTQLAAPAERTGRDTSEGFDVVRGGKHRSRGRRRQAGGTEKWDADKAREELLEVFGEVKSDGKRIEVLVWCMEWVDLQGRGHHILDEYRPAFVILYNADLALVRQVEVFKASQPGRPVRMYILAYEDAVEEERFRQSSGREKAAFKSLIRERATMTVHVNPEPIPEEVRFTQTVLEDMGRGRKGLGVDRDSRMAPKVVLKKGSEKVLVDTRELRSSLPMLLYQSSLTIVSLTLEVGDFILSKNIGIERKSVPDLYGSFGSGRLFNQAEALCRHYKYPCLLIELDPLRSLSLTATSGGVPTELVATSIVSKMVLLLQQFPSFRLLWAKGPHDAAEMFSTLKANEEEPDESIAAALGVDTKETVGEDFNAGPRALLRSLPGIDSQNMVRVMKKVKDVASLISMSKEEMAEVLGSAGKATSLYEFVNEQPSEALAAL